MCERRNKASGGVTTTRRVPHSKLLGDSLVLEIGDSPGQIVLCEYGGAVRYGGTVVAAQSKFLEAKHRSCSGFNTAVILLDQIVQVLRPISTWYASECLVFVWHLPNRSVRCSVAIQSDTDRCTFVGTKRLAEKTPWRPRCPWLDLVGSRRVSPFRSTALIKIHPSSAHFKIRLVNTPGPANFTPQSESSASRTPEHTVAPSA